ncbi:MAG: G1 family glutamic endopeptidase [Parachlamydiaceae bacterium]
MKKIVSFFLLLNFIFTFNFPGYGEEDVDKQSANHLLIETDDDDGYQPLTCELRSIDRKSTSVRMCASNHQPLHTSTKSEANSLSFNWSGYTSFTGKNDIRNPTYGSATAVSGSWIIPPLTSSEEGDTYSSAWVGIDGYANSVVEQIGTEHDVIEGVPVYFAWFEMYPAAAQVIEGFPVFEGDLVEGKVLYLGQDASTNDLFRLTIKNHTRKVKFSINQSTLPGNPAHLSSVEWIVEAPVNITPEGCVEFLPLANFGKIFFGNCQATINGLKGSIDNKHWTYDAITMVARDGTVKDTPSLLFSNCKDSNSSRSSNSDSISDSFPKSLRKGPCKSSSFYVDWMDSGPFPYDSSCLD